MNKATVPAAPIPPTIQPMTDLLDIAMGMPVTKRIKHITNKICNSTPEEKLVPALSRGRRRLQRREGKKHV